MRQRPNQVAPTSRAQQGLRRWVAVVVGAVSLLPVLVVVPAGPAAGVARAVVGSPCDASGDGVPGGVVEEVVSSGADLEASKLTADTGLVLAPARRAHRWRVPVCVEVVDDGDPATEDRRVEVVGPAVEELKPEAAGWERSALDKALKALRPSYFRPGARTSPHVDGVQVVGLEMWLAVDPGVWRPFTETKQVGEVDVTASATPRRVVWSFSDGVVEACEGPGVQWTAAAAGPAPCGRDFTRTTAGQAPMILEVTLEYEVAWSSSIGGAGTQTDRGEPRRHELVVGEVQAYLTDGNREAPGRGDPLPLPESSQPMNDSDCSWATAWKCSLNDIADAAADAAGAVAGALIGPLKAAVEQVWSFLTGCAAFVGEVFGSVQEVLGQMGQLVSDPQKFLDEKLGLARSMLAAVQEDPKAFATEMLGEAIELDLLQSDPAKWAGKIGCELAVGILTGGAAAAGGRFANLFADVNSFMRKIDDWLKRRNNGDTNGDGDGDDSSGACPTGSFSASTHVLMADRTTKPISQVRVGDAVLATDPVSRTSGPRTVLAELPHTDLLLTLMTSAGEIVTTEDHQYWNVTDREWQESQHLDPGDGLLTPDGAEVTVIGLDWATAITAAAFDLTVDDLHSYHVVAGNHAVLVHNCGSIRGTRGLDHSFDEHAAEWFGRPVPRATHMEEWTALIERAARSSKTFEWSSGPDPTTAHLARIDGKNFVVQFYLEGPRAGQLATAFVPNQDQLSAMLRLLEG